jgi:GTP cyclohydrolase I
MIASLPDIARTAPASASIDLDWVGMQKIELPVRIDATEIGLVPATADIHVDLPRSAGRGIHMSRLYLLLDRFTSDHVLSPPVLHRLLDEAVATHQDCATRRARLALRFSCMIRRPALVTAGLSGWRRYPVTINAQVEPNVGFSLSLGVEVSYSSTCPCSAALARQLLQQQYLRDFDNRDQVEVQETADWLYVNGSIATPHSQRSSAFVEVGLPGESPDLGIRPLLDCIERTLGTPVQTAVKRADEQAFAAANGANLMYVEDAARRLHQALADRYPGGTITVHHYESLHPHDAYAQTAL